MARIRTIKPEFWHDEKLGALKRDERLLFIGLWNLADDEGAVIANPVFIKSSLFPYDDDLRMNTLTSWLSNLQQARTIIPFTFNGESYYKIRTFSDHQVINRPSKTKWPAGFIQGIVTEGSPNTHGVLTEPSHQEGNRKGKGNGIGKEGEAGEAPDARFEKKLILENPFSEQFLQTWILWKDYKKKEHRFLFKSIESEQAALNELVNLSEGNEKTAQLIIHQSLAHGWKGLFKLKNDETGNPKNGKRGGPTTGTDLHASVAKFRSQGQHN